MKTAKEEIKKMLKNIPDNSSLEDIQYHIYVQEKIEHGLNEVHAGKTLSQKEMEQRMSRWLGK